MEAAKVTNLNLNSLWLALFCNLHPPSTHTDHESMRHTWHSKDLSSDLLLKWNIEVSKPRSYTSIHTNIPSPKAGVVSLQSFRHHTRWNTIQIHCKRLSVIWKQKDLVQQTYIIYMHEYYLSCDVADVAHLRRKTVTSLKVLAGLRKAKTWASHFLYLPWATLARERDTTTSTCLRSISTPTRWNSKKQLPGQSRPCKASTSAWPEKPLTEKALEVKNFPATFVFRGKF